MTPIEVVMNLTLEMAEKGLRRNYELQSVIFHYGEVEKGSHYISFVKRSGAIWWLINDNNVEMVSAEAVVAYSKCNQMVMAFFAWRADR